MTDQTGLVPKRRFKEFLNSHAWEQRRFEDLLDSTDGIRRGPFGSALKKEYFVSESDYVVYEQQNAIYDRYDTRYYITKEKYDELHRFKVTSGDFIMSGAGTIGRISRVPEGIKHGVFNQALIRMKVDTEITDSEFFLQMMRSEDMQRKLTDANPASAMVNLVPMSEVKEWVILVPQKLEQSKIGAFFKDLDHLITLHQRKLEKSKSLKAAYLSEMFPAEGESEPKRRFAGFTGAWEQLELGEVLDNQYNGQTPSRADTSFWNGDINWLTSGELNRGVVSNAIEKITEDGRKNANLKIVPKGTFVMAITGLEAAGTRGNCAKLGIDTTLNQSCMALYPNEKLLNASFLFQWYRKVGEEYGLNYTQGTKQQSYNAELIKILPITLPSVSEQIQIANFFDSLDNLIALHQRKLEKLQNLKKAYLNEMFV